MLGALRNEEWHPCCRRLEKMAMKYTGSTSRSFLCRRDFIEASASPYSLLSSHRSSQDLSRSAQRNTNRPWARLNLQCLMAKLRCPMNRHIEARRSLAGFGMKWISKHHVCPGCGNRTSLGLTAQELRQCSGFDHIGATIVMSISDDL